MASGLAVRYRLALTETTDTGPDTADADDLQRYVKEYTSEMCMVEVRLAAAIAAALPKPRIKVEPGVVLWRTDPSDRFFVYQWGRVNRVVAAYGDGRGFDVPKDGLDPDEWTVLLDAEEPA